MRFRVGQRGEEERVPACHLLLIVWVQGLGFWVSVSGLLISVPGFGDWTRGGEEERVPACLLHEGLGFNVLSFYVYGLGVWGLGFGLWV